MPPLWTAIAGTATSSTNSDSRSDSSDGAPSRSSCMTSGRLRRGSLSPGPQRAYGPMVGRRSWGAGGAFKTSPRLRAHVYTAHARCSGFPTPCVYALLPNKTAGTYAPKWAAIRANIDQAAADADRLIDIDFEVAPLGARPLPSLGFGSHVSISIWRNRSFANRINSPYSANTMPPLRSNCGRGCSPPSRSHQSRRLRPVSSSSRHYSLTTGRRPAPIWKRITSAVG